VAPNWDERYGEDGYAFGTEPNDFLVEARRHLPPGMVLCIGDGEGRNSVHLAEMGYEVTSIDTSSVGLAKAIALAMERDVTITTTLADLADYQPAPSSATGVVSIFCHLPSAVRAVAYPRLVDALAPGGVWIMEAYTPEQIGRGTGGPSDPDLLLTELQVADELVGLNTVLLETTERDVIEGRYHSGLASVVRYIGRKPLS